MTSIQQHVECILASVLRRLQGRCVYYIRCVSSCASYVNDKALQRPYQPGIRDQIANGWDAYLSHLTSTDKQPGHQRNPTPLPPLNNSESTGSNLMTTN
jgi:hypothetical protein